MNFRNLFSLAKKVAEDYSLPVLTRSEVRFCRRLLKEMDDNAQDQIVFVEGDRGSGKSLAGGRICQGLGICLKALGVWEKPSDRWTLTFDSRDFAEQIGDYDSLRMYDVRMFEEPQTGEASQYRQQTLEGQLISSAVQAWRHKQQIFLVTAASGSKLNIGLRQMKTYLLTPPLDKWRRYVYSGYRSGRGRNLNKKARKSAWDLKACEFSPSINDSICRWVREKDSRTGKKRRLQFIYLRHPGVVWEERYEERKPVELGRIFRRRYEELPWVEARREAEEKARSVEEDIF